jgi:hypothetical protein
LNHPLTTCVRKCNSWPHISPLHPTMSALRIPNLNTLRRDGGRRGGRGRGAASSGPESSPNTNPIAKDKIVQSTDNDAATSRLSAVEAGYLDDPFTKMLTQGQNVDRRLPLMNRGAIYRNGLWETLSERFRYICSDNSHRSTCRCVPGIRSAGS